MSRLLFGTLLLSALVPSGLSAAPSSRPNILFFFTDDQPQSCLGVAGNPHIKTPHLDALAARGAYFENAFVTTAICCSSRASILTGQHMHRHGITEFRTPLSAEAFDQSYPALLRKAGYRTGYLGKFAIGNPGFNDRALCLPADKFDTWYGFPQNINFKQKVDGEPRFLTSVMTEKAVDFLRGSKDKPEQPFCLTVAFKEPHGPFNYFDPEVTNPYEGIQIPPPQTFTRGAFEAQPEFIRKSLNGSRDGKRLPDPGKLQSDLRTFYRTVTRADMAVGEILAALKKFGLEKNTVVIFSSDHGSLLGDHGLMGKWLMYENSIRVPLIVFDPRVDPAAGAGKREQIALNIDLAPTMLALAAIEPPAGMQGKSLVPLVRGEKVDWRSHFYYEHTYNTEPPRASIAKCEGIRDRRWKYIRYPDSDPPFEQLFDLENDPMEQSNLAEIPEQAARLKNMRALCDAR